MGASARVDWVEERDVLVAGSGGGGSLAPTPRREGLDVLLVEATGKFGGTTAYSGGGGVWFPCNPVLLRAGTDDTIEDALTFYHAVVGDRTRRELQETFVRGDKEGEVPPVKAPNVTIVETEKYVVAGLWHSADTIGELAGKIGLPPQRLAATVARRILGGRVAPGRDRPAAFSRRRVRVVRPGHQRRPADRHRGPGARHVRQPDWDQHAVQPSRRAGHAGPAGRRAQLAAH